jgi:hypothetical protein
MLLEPLPSNGSIYGIIGTGNVNGDINTVYQATSTARLAVGEYMFCNIDKLGSANTVTMATGYESAQFMRLQN